MLSPWREWMAEPASSNAASKAAETHFHSKNNPSMSKNKVKMEKKDLQLTLLQRSFSQATGLLCGQRHAASPSCFQISKSQLAVLRRTSQMATVKTQSKAQHCFRLFLEWLLSVLNPFWRPCLSWQPTEIFFFFFRLWDAHKHSN